MSDRRRFSMSLSLDSPLQRRAWEILSAIPARQRTEAVCCAIVQYQDRRAAAEILRETLREELQNVSLTRKENTEPEKAVEISDSVLDFLASL